MASLTGTEVHDGGSSKTKDDCSWAIHSSDQPGMVLVTSPLTRSNYLTWRQSIMTSLESKEKLCFVNGSLPSLDKSDSAAYRKWKNVDSMIKSWILNSISNDLADHFIYFPSALALWKELETRYGMSSGPQIYQIQRLINTVQQGNDPVSTYYGRLYKCWDELHRLMPRAVCTCSAHKTNDEIESSLKLNQFLMGLSESYDALRSQILAMKPKPTVSEAFSMVAQMETEREVKMSLGGSAEASALMAKAIKNDGEVRGGKNKDNKKDRQCNHCGNSGHTRETCFKLNGFPDWWKEKKPVAGKKQHANMVISNETDNPLEMKESTDLSSMISQLVKQEIAKLSKGTDEVASFAHTLDFAGNASNLETLMMLGTWIIDTSASSHMSHDRTLLNDIKILKSPITVHLPEGKTIVAKEVGRAIINNDLTLENVLLIPAFKYNLLSVRKIIKGSINVIFNSLNCLVQDHTTKRTLAVGESTSDPLEPEPTNSLLPDPLTPPASPTPNTPLMTSPISPTPYPNSHDATAKLVLPLIVVHLVLMKYNTSNPYPKTAILCLLHETVPEPDNHQHGVDAARVRHYNFHVGYLYKSVDCVDGVVMGINGQFPGPTIRAEVGDTIDVAVTNKFATEGTVIHWHGIRQYGSPWADGTAGVSQCPINPGETFHYRFKLEKSGTYFYHGHYGMQRAGGLYGSIIVDLAKGQKEPFHYDDEINLLLSDYWHKSASEQQFGLTTKFESFRWVWEPQNHKMVVVQVDGNYVEPFTVDNLDIYSGESYSVLLNTDQNPNKNYWISLGHRDFNISTTPALTLLNYQVISRSVLPSSPPPVTPPWYDREGRKIFVKKLIALKGTPQPPKYSQRRVVLLNTQDIIDGYLRMVINNISLSLPETPYLGAIKFNLKDAFDWRAPPESFPEDYDIYVQPQNLNAIIGNRVYKFEYDQVVDVILQNANAYGKNKSAIHPWHLHGHDFWVLGYGEGKFKDGDEKLFNLKNPPLRNNVVVFPYGWTALRFRANNPGVWTFHCHMEPHFVTGMGVVFAEGVEHVKGIPEQALNCGQTRDYMLLNKKTHY
ncbi:L-ascorbate oxidase [Senna tora]|uniref:L-ascorbate oxidase n=1 Tax=Senna tora TaxID=362788 RepID=A0A834TE41_9FABA|nr:L-ascorbate oxidase [Senna tora]